jgi:hypothetical protein
VPLSGIDGTALQRTIEVAAARRGKGEPAPSAELLDPPSAPWPFGLAVAAGAIEAFVRRAFGD